MAKRLRAWKAEYLVLTRPLGRAIAETGNSKSARQATFDGRSRVSVMWPAATSLSKAMAVSQRSISPNTMSSEPMIAETSASICPRLKKSIACRWANDGALGFSQPCPRQRWVARPAPWPAQEITPSHPRDLRSVPQSKRDDDIRGFGLVQLEARPVVIAPAGEIHDLSRLGCRPGGLDRFHDVEPMAVEEERVLPEQVVELWNQGMIVWNGPSFELA